MKDLMKMKRDRKVVVDEMRAMLTAAETRTDKKLTGEEETRYKELESKVQQMSADIEREERLQALEAGTAAAAAAAAPGPNEIRAFGDFLQEVRFNPSNPVLQTREVKGAKGEKRDMTMGNGVSAGFMVPEQFDRTLRMVEPNQAIFRPRSLVIPAGDPADAAMNLLALDQSGALGVYSGVVVRWIAENAARQDAGDPHVRQIKIEPNEVSGYIDISDKLLRNSAAVGALVEKLLRLAIIGSEEAAFYTGDGIGKPLGIIGCSASINVARAGTGAIAYADVRNVFARAKFGGSLAWIGSQTILTQLMAMVDAGTHNIWQPNAREGAPSTLLGLPLLMNDQSPVLGSRGDLALVDLSYYAIKDGSPLAIFMDPFTQKANGVTRLYAFWNVDGQPMLTTPMLQRDGVSTVSPFVVLQ